MKLNGALVSGGNVENVEISPDGKLVVYVADEDEDEVFELYSRPIDGSGSPIKLSGALVGGGDVRREDREPARIRTNRGCEVHASQLSADRGYFQRSIRCVG